jgi:Uncharacterized protein involved in exopolysaccharide biosynthesis
MQHDEIYLVDLWRICAREWMWFVLVLALTLASTYAFAHLAKRQWEATAWIQIGQVGQVPAGQDPKAEPLQRVTERLQLVPFQNEILQSAGYAPTSAVAGLYRKSLKLEPMLYAGSLVHLSVRAYSRQQAGELAAATVARLRLVHQQLEAAPLKSAHARLDETQADLQSALADRARLLQAGAAAGRSAAGGSAAQGSLLADMLLARKNEEIRELRLAKSDLTERLDPTYTYETSMVWPVYVPEHQAFPNPALTWGIGLLLGIFLGVSASVARNTARRSA